MNYHIFNRGQHMKSVPSLEFFNESTGLFALTTDLPTKELDFFRKIGITHNSRVLEQCCGRGYLSNLLTKSISCKTLGIDIVPEYINYAKKFAFDNNLITRFEQGDLLSDKCYGLFNYVINWNTSWAYFEDDEKNSIFLINAFKNLRSGGQFVLEFYNSEYVLKNFQKQRESTMKIDDVEYKLIKDSEISNGLLNSEWTIFKEDEIIFQNKFLTRMYTVTDIKNMLEKVGFKDVQVLNKETFENHEKESKKNVFICKK